MTEICMTNHKRCEVQPNHIHIAVNGDHLELCSFRYIRIVDISYTALLELEDSYTAQSTNSPHCSPEFKSSLSPDHNVIIFVAPSA